MRNIKKPLIIGAGIVTLGAGSLGSIGIAHAATSMAASANDQTALVDKLATTFHLDKTKVQAVFNENKQARHSEMEQKRVDALKQAVTDSKLTQSQADHITSAWSDMDKIHDSVSSPKDLTAAQKTDLKTKREALQTWLKAQNLDLKTILGLPDKGMGHHRVGDDTSGK